MSFLEVEALSKSFEDQPPAVDNVSLAIDRGEIVCLLGPSGCGKTTLLRIIAGLETADSGQVWFDGQNMSGVAPHLRDFGMMFQDFALFPHKNVEENIGFGLKMHGQSEAEIVGRVQEMLDLVALPGFGERDVAQLSGGEQQRVALARALAPEPRLLMLDEPLGALDRALRERLMLDLRQILKQVGVTAVYVTHDQTEAFAVGDRIALMNAGHIEQFDTPHAVFNCPQSQFAARFLGFRNILEAQVSGPQSVATALGEFVVAQPCPQPDAPLALLLRPESATLVSDPTANIDNVVRGNVEALSFRGRYTQVWVNSEGLRLMFELSDDLPPVGSPITLKVDPEDTNLLPAA